jgi:uncharacterized protein
MHTNFSDPQKAGIFTVVVLALAVAAALIIDAFGLGSNFFAWASVWSITPVLATVIMLLVVTRDGYSKQGWRTLGCTGWGFGCGGSHSSAPWRSLWSRTWWYG